MVVATAAAAAAARVGMAVMLATLFEAGRGRRVDLGGMTMIMMMFVGRRS
jgi:hypothetical protein